MTDNTKRLKGYRENARAVLDSLDAAIASDDVLRDRLIDALYSDVTGLLIGLSEGTLRTGQPRLVEQMIQIVKNYPADKDPTPFIEAIAACGEHGLSADGHALHTRSRDWRSPDK